MKRWRPLTCQIPASDIQLMGLDAEPGCPELLIKSVLDQTPVVVPLIIMKTIGHFSVGYPERWITAPDMKSQCTRGGTKKYPKLSLYIQSQKAPYNCLWCPVRESRCNRSQFRSNCLQDQPLQF